MRFKKYLMLFILMISYNVIAQNKENILLSEHLSNIESKYQFTFSLDAELIKNISIPIADTASLTKDDAIQKLTSLVPFKFTAIDTANILVLPIQASNTKLQFVIIDDDEELIPGVFAKVKNKKITAVSNENGLITLEGVLTPYDSVTFDGFGFNKITYSVAQLQHNDENQIIITPVVTKLEETIIEGYIVSGINSIVNDHGIQIKQSDLDIIPGQTSGDVLQSIAILPGISSPNTKAGNLFLRGSTIDQTLVYFDNIPLYNKGHFFGTISPFNQLAVDEVNVYRNGSHPRIGGRIGGTLEVKTTSEISDSTSKAIGISMTDVLAYVKAPIIKDRLDILISARHSLPSSLNTPRQESILDIINQDSPFEHRYKKDTDAVDIIENKHEFKDVNGKITYKKDSTEITTSFLYTKSFRNREYVDIDPNLRSIDYLGGENKGINTQWSETWNRALSTNVSASISKYNNLTQNKEEKTPNTPLESTKYFYTNITDFGLKVEARYFNKKDLNYIDFGYNLDIHDNAIASTDVTPRGEINVDNKQIGKINSFYGHYNIRSLKKHSLNIGARISHFDVLNKLYYEPRIFYNYQITKPFSFKAALSVNNQYIQQLISFDFNDSKPDNYNWGIANNEQIPARSFQKVIGILYSKNNWVIDIEAYQKNINNIVITGGFNVQTSQLNLYNGYANMYGTDVLIRKKINRLSLWTSYSISKVLWHFDSLSTHDFHAYYDQRHQLNIGSNYKLKKLSISTNLKIVSGLPKQVITGLEPINRNGETKSIEEIGRYNWHHQLDISMSYKIAPKSKKWNMLLSVSLYNIYNHQTLIDEQTERQSTYNIYTIGFSPNLQLIVNF